MELVGIVNLVTIILPLAAILVTYAKTWSRFEVLIQNLSTSIERLSMVTEEIRKDQNNMGTKIQKVESDLRVLNTRLTYVEHNCADSHTITFSQTDANETV